MNVPVIAGHDPVTVRGRRVDEAISELMREIEMSGQKKPARNVEKLLTKKKTPKLKKADDVTLAKRFKRKTTKPKPVGVLALLADALARKKKS